MPSGETSCLHFDFPKAVSPPNVLRQMREFRPRAPRFKRGLVFRLAPAKAEGRPAGVLRQVYPAKMGGIRLAGCNGRLKGSGVAKCSILWVARVVEWQTRQT